MYLFKSGCSGYQTRIKLSCSRPKFNFAQTGETWQGLTATPYKKLSTADGRRCHMLISLMVDGRISISHLVRRSLSPNNNPSVKRIPPVSNAESDSQKRLHCTFGSVPNLAEFQFRHDRFGEGLSPCCAGSFFSQRVTRFSSVTSRAGSRKTHGKSQGFVKSNDAFPFSASGFLTFLDVLPPWQIQKMLTFRLLSGGLEATIHPHAVYGEQPRPTSTHSTSTSTTPQSIRGAKNGGHGGAKDNERRFLHQLG